MKDLFEALEKSLSNYNLDEGVSNKDAVNDIVSLTEEAEQHGIYSYDGQVTRYGKPIGNMKLETEADSKRRAVSNLKFRAAKEAGYSSPAGIGIDENKVKFKLKEYLEDNMYPRTEAYKFILDFVADATEYLDNKDNFTNNREEYERAYLYFLDLVKGIKDKRDAGRFLRKILKEKNNNDSFLTKRSIEDVEDNLSVNDPAYVDEFQKQVMELGKKESIVYEFDTADAKYRDTLNLYESNKKNVPTKKIVESKTINENKLPIYEIFRSGAVAVDPASDEEFEVKPLMFDEQLLRLIDKDGDETRMYISDVLETYDIYDYRGNKVSDREEYISNNVNESKKLNEAPYLEPIYDSRKSFYNKAFIDKDVDGNDILKSYGTLVAKIVDGKPEVYTNVDIWDSNTTLRHIKDFLKQRGFKADTKAQIARDYGTDLAEGCKKKSGKRLTESHKIKADNYTVGQIEDAIRDGIENNDPYIYFVFTDSRGNTSDVGINLRYKYVWFDESGSGDHYNNIEDAAEMVYNHNKYIDAHIQGVDVSMTGLREGLDDGVVYINVYRYDGDGNKICEFSHKFHDMDSAKHEIALRVKEIKANDDDEFSYEYIDNGDDFVEYMLDDARMEERIENNKAGDKSESLHKKKLREGFSSHEIDDAYSKLIKELADRVDYPDDDDDIWEAIEDGLKLEGRLTAILEVLYYNSVAADNIMDKYGVYDKLYDDVRDYKKSENLTEDTVKVKDGVWVNKGDDGTHGKFKTKKEADAQRKAMFANGYKESLKEDADEATPDNGDEHVYKITFDVDYEGAVEDSDKSHGDSEIEIDEEHIDDSNVRGAFSSEGFEKFKKYVDDSYNIKLKSASVDHGDMGKSKFVIAVTTEGSLGDVADEMSFAKDISEYALEDSIDVPFTEHWTAEETYWRDDILDTDTKVVEYTDNDVVYIFDADAENLKIEKIK